MNNAYEEKLLNNEVRWEFSFFWPEEERYFVTWSQGMVMSKHLRDFSLVFFFVSQCLIWMDNTQKEGDSKWRQNTCNVWQ